MQDKEHITKKNGKLLTPDELRKATFACYFRRVSDGSYLNKLKMTDGLPCYHCPMSERNRAMDRCHLGARQYINDGKVPMPPRHGGRPQEWKVYLDKLSKVVIENYYDPLHVDLLKVKELTDGKNTKRMGRGRV